MTPNEAGSRAARLHQLHREALTVMGANEDTLEGFDVGGQVMRELCKMGYVNTDDENPRHVTYWLNRDGIAMHEAVVAQNRAIKGRSIFSSGK